MNAGHDSDNQPIASERRAAAPQSLPGQDRKKNKNKTMFVTACTPIVPYPPSNNNYYYYYHHFFKKERLEMSDIAEKVHRIVQLLGLTLPNKLGCTMQDSKIHQTRCLARLKNRIASATRRIHRLEKFESP